MAPLTHLLVVSHTHWDREWYHTADTFRERLVALVDDLIDSPPEGPASFLLDGQGVILDDYMSVRPERAAELSRLLRDGRIEAGPWYVLADELIPSGEALVRNLTIGRDTVRRLRGETPKVLYCPDSFGHPAMLPAIGAGFGLEVAIVWRGLGGSRWPAGDTFRWEAPDGSAVTVYHLPPDGYEFGSSLPTAPEAAAERWERIAATLAPRARTGVALLLNGADHHARQIDLQKALAALSEAARSTGRAGRSPSAQDERVKVRATSLAAAAAALRAIDSNALPCITGELRDSYGYTWTLGGTLATRAQQKRHNARVERLLTRDTEPWLALLPEGASASSRALLRSAWRTLLTAHPHDTLCGTSIDAVARAMDSRMDSAADQARALRNSALELLVGHDAVAARSAHDEWRPAVVVRNPAARKREGIVELTLRAKIADVAVGPGSASRQGGRQRPPAIRVDGMRVQVLERAERVELTESPQAYPDADSVVEVSAVGWMTPIDGYVVETRPQRGRGIPSVPNPVVATGSSLTNGLVRIEVSERGAVRFEDLTSGRVVENALRLERMRDVGDLYTPAIREALEPPTFVRSRVASRGPIRGALELELRVGGTRARNTTTCRLRLELDASALALRVLASGQNQERDQRLRLLIATDVEHGRTIADAAFGPVERRRQVVDDADAAVEQVVHAAPLHRWVARTNTTRCAVVISDGLAEYESLDDGGVAITLVRSVGELSRHDLRERPGHAGWPVSTPEAQCLGPFKAQATIALLPSYDDAISDTIEHLAEDELLPLVGVTLRSNMKAATSAGGVELMGDGLAFSAVLPAEAHGWIVLRCVNLRDAVARGEWCLTRAITIAVKSRLDETHIEPLEVTEGRITFTAGPREIFTILAR